MRGAAIRGRLRTRRRPFAPPVRLSVGLSLACAVAASTGCHFFASATAAPVYRMVDARRPGVVVSHKRVDVVFPASPIETSECTARDDRSAMHLHRWLMSYDLPDGSRPSAHVMLAGLEIERPSSVALADLRADSAVRA